MFVYLGIEGPFWFTTTDYVDRTVLLTHLFFTFVKLTNTINMEKSWINYYCLHVFLRTVFVFSSLIFLLSVFSQLNRLSLSTYLPRKNPIKRVMFPLQLISYVHFTRFFRLEDENSWSFVVFSCFGILWRVFKLLSGNFLSLKLEGCLHKGIQSLSFVFIFGKEI